jgi:WD40-like Beta Propeller Repeat
MKRLAGPLRARALALMLGLTAQACMSSTLVLHVRPDGGGHARITSRVFEPSIRAFDSLFPDTPSVAPTLAELLPAPTEGELERNFGTRVKLGSTSLEKAADGGVRVTVVDFEDVTKLRMAFPSVFSVPAGSSFEMSGVDDAAVVRFSIKPHENGDRLLLVTLPDQRMTTDPNPQITSFASDSAQELTLKRAIKGLALRFFVEIEQPLLRTNAPARSASRATIFDLDLDKMINAMDEPKVRRMMSPGSLQEMLWQLGDLPGAIIPVDREVFLEFEGPQAPPPPAAPPARAPQPPPDTEIYLAPMTIANGAIELGPAVNITSNPGYDNQPSFTPDGKGILFTSVRGGPSTALGAGGSQTDIYKYDIASKQTAQVTSTPESEYSPTVTPAGTISVVRVELDEAKTQRLWQFTAGGRDPRLVLETIKPVGYHAWSDDHTLALFVLGQPATLQLADTRSGTAVPLASDIGRSIQQIRGPQAAAGSISFVQRERNGDVLNLVIKELNPATRATSVLTPAVAGATEADTAWTPDGTLLMVKGGTLYGWRRGQSGWKEVASLERLSLAGVTRLAVSPNGDYLALVGSPTQGR